MGGAIAEKSKDDEKKSRQEEFSKLHIKEGKGEAGEEKELLKKIREKHGFFHIGFSDREMLVRRRLREMPEEDRIPVMRMAAYLCECSPSYSFGAIHAIFSDKSNPAKHIKNLYDNVRKLMDAGVDPSFACVFANGSNLQHIDDFAKVNEILKGEILKGTVQGHRLNSLSQEQIAALAETATKVGDDRIKLVVQNVEENFRMGLGMLSKLLICLHGADRETTEFWLDRLEDLRKTYEQKGPRAARKLAKTVGTWEQPSGSLRRSLKELKELMDWRKVDINIKKIEGGPEHAKELIDATVLTFRRKSSDELFKDQARLIEERGNLQGVEKKAFDIWFFYNAGATPSRAINIALTFPKVDEVFEKSVSALEKYGDDEHIKTVFSREIFFNMEPRGLTEKQTLARLDDFSSCRIDTYSTFLSNSGLDYTVADYISQMDNDLHSARKTLSILNDYQKLPNELKYKKERINSILLDIHDADEEQMGFWLDRIGVLYKISEYIYEEFNPPKEEQDSGAESQRQRAESQRHIVKAIDGIVKVVRNDAQLSSFLEAFDKLDKMLENYINTHGEWRYILADERYGSVSNHVEMIPTKGQVDINYTKIGSYDNGRLELKRKIPRGDKKALLRVCKREMEGARVSEETWVGGAVKDGGQWEIYSLAGTIYLDYAAAPNKRDFENMFTKEFFELFVDESMPLEERLKAIRKEVENFWEEFMPENKKTPRSDDATSVELVRCSHGGYYDRGPARTSADDQRQNPSA